jgi:hypothetical protein
VKSPAEIAAEVKALEAIKWKLPLTNIFGESIPAKVDIQIEVLLRQVEDTEFEDLVEDGEWREEYEED